MQAAPQSISHLRANECFVFGSNSVGHHGGGAAGIAFRGDPTPIYSNIQGIQGNWCVGGIARGYQEGTTGRSYAIVTKSATLDATGRVRIGGRRSVSLAEIGDQIKEFIVFAQNTPRLNFLVTEIGCGMAGYSSAEIGKLFVGLDIPQNVYSVSRPNEVQLRHPLLVFLSQPA